MRGRNNILHVYQPRPTDLSNKNVFIYFEIQTGMTHAYRSFLVLDLAYKKSKTDHFFIHPTCEGLKKKQRLRDNARIKFNEQNMRFFFW